MKISAELYRQPNMTSLFQPKMFTKFIALLFFIAVLTAVLLNLKQQAFPELADSLVFQRIDGVKQSFKVLKGKPLLVTFWSPNCVICMQEVKDLNRLYTNHQGGKKFELLALSMYYDRPDRVIQTSQQSGMKYPVYFDLQKTLSRAFGNVVATPTSFLLNPRGEIIYRHEGRQDFTLIDQKLSEITL